MSRETKKATLRRKQEVKWKSVVWQDVFSGNGIDVGPGKEPLADWNFNNLVLFDKFQGDANKIDEYFPENHFDFLHGSQILEHLHNPIVSLRKMIKIVKPGGWIVATVPDFDLYEHGVMPSRNNRDHKTTWSLWRKKSPTPFPHIFVPLLRKAFDNCFVDARLCSNNYDFMNYTTDQTVNSLNLIEAFIEIVIRKSV